jgi:hypothetical protein
MKLCHLKIILYLILYHYFGIKINDSFIITATGLDPAEPHFSKTDPVVRLEIGRAHV